MTGEENKAEPAGVILLDGELLKRIESVLFAAGKKLRVEDIATLCGKRGEEKKIIECLLSLQGKYTDSNSSLMVVQDGDCWKLTVHERFLPFVRKIVTQTELKKSVMETLAVLAYKAPMLQSELIKIRTNKAYDHLLQLEEEGYIVRKKKGRTKEISLAPKFFEYFDLPAESMKARFSSVAKVEEEVLQAESRLKEKMEEIIQRKENLKHEEDSYKHAQEKTTQALDKAIAEHPVIELVNDKGQKVELQTYQQAIQKTDEPLESQIEIIENKLGTLEIVKSEPRVEIVDGEITALGEMEVIKEAPEEEAKEIIGEQSESQAGDVDRRVAEILSGFMEPKEEEKKGDSDKKEDEDNKKT